MVARPLANMGVVAEISACMITTLLEVELLA
jgi:hypothetical protein